MSTAYSSAQTTATKVLSMDCPTAGKFLASLSLDVNGNINFEEVHLEKTHSLRLSDSHRSQRGQSEDARLQKIKDSLVQIKSDVWTCMISLKILMNDFRDWVHSLMSLRPSAFMRFNSSALLMRVKVLTQSPSNRMVARFSSIANHLLTVPMKTLLRK